MELTEMSWGTVLIRIPSEAKAAIFETSIKDALGQNVKLIKALHAGYDEDKHFSQSVHLGEVILVADDIIHIVPGDIVCLDYLADADRQKVMYFDGDDKIIALKAKTNFYTANKVARANMQTRQDVFTWKIGDVEYYSLIYAIYRDGQLIPNDHYILLEHKEMQWMAMKGGLLVQDYEGFTCARKIMAIPPECKYNVGDYIVVGTEYLYERSILNMNFDVVMVNDILGVLKN